jgi:uncharacterized protein (DUF2141 family)
MIKKLLICILFIVPLHADEGPVFSLTVFDVPRELPVVSEVYTGSMDREPVAQRTDTTDSGRLDLLFTGIEAGTCGVRLFIDTDRSGTKGWLEKAVSTDTADSPLFSVPGHAYISLKHGILETVPVSIRIADIDPAQGTVHAALFRNGTLFIHRSGAPEGGSMTMVIPEVPEGEYTVSLSHDANDNGVISEDETRIPAGEGEALGLTLSPDAGFAYQETLFAVKAPGIGVEASMKHGFFRTAELRVRLKGFTGTDGMVRVTLFTGKKGFPNKPKHAFRVGENTITGDQAAVTFTGIPFGTYGVGAFHDENDNGKMDTNFVGVPKEGYGASNDARGSFGPPSFEDAAFTVDRETVEIIINMEY